MEMTQAKGRIQWMRISRLYRQAFPKNERKPLSIIKRNQKLGKSDVWYFEEDGKFLGLATTVNGRGPVLVDYFAVVKGSRDKGHGGEMLDALIHHYRNRGFFGEIELAEEGAPDFIQRSRRKQFYLRHGLVPQKVYVDLFGVEMEVLAIGCEMDFEAYYSFYCENIGEIARKNVKELDRIPEC